MLPLASQNAPASPEDLAAALAGGFAARSVEVKSVRAEGATLAALDELAVDLSGARFTRGFRLAASAERGSATVRAGRFEVVGAPLFFESTPVQLRVEAEDAELHFAGSPAEGALVLAGVARGALSLAVAQADLEAVLQQLGRDAAEKQGVEIKKTRLELTASGPRSLAFRGEVTAKMFVMSADLSLSGQLEVDEQLNARISGLTLGGDAMIIKLAGGFIRPHLDKLEGWVIPLGALLPAGLPLRDVEIATAGGLEIRAKFGRD